MKQTYNYYDHITQQSPYNLKELSNGQQQFKIHLLELFAQYGGVTLDEITDLFGRRLDEVIALRRRYCDYYATITQEMKLMSFHLKDRSVIEVFLEAGKKWFA